MSNLARIAVAAAVALAALTPIAAASVPSGRYAGTLDAGAHAIRFRVEAARISRVVARMRLDCDGDIDTERIDSPHKWRVEGNRFRGTKTEYDGVSSYTVVLRGRFRRGGKVTGSIRAYYSAELEGRVCDTGTRRFAARRVR